VSTGNLHFYGRLSAFGIQRLFDFLLVALIFVVPLILLSIGDTEIDLLLSFVAVDIVLALYLMVVLFIDNKNVANIFTFIFFYLFFLIAPILQISNAAEVTLVNTLPINIDRLVYVNFLTILFLVLYLIGYLLAQLFWNRKTILSPVSIESGVVEPVLVFLIFISVFAAFLAYKDVRSKVILVELLETAGEEASLSQGLLKAKVFYNIPLATYLFCLFFYRGNMKWLILGVLFVLVVVTKNPVLERRNAVGATYLTILYSHVAPYFRTNRSTFLLFFGLFVIFFPLSSIFTHGNVFLYGFRSLDIGSVLIDHFTQLHYDAWANYAAGIEYISSHGHTFGRQVLGVLLFFVPRSLWSSKPVSSGELIGDYLMAEHEMWFNNLSFPLHAEAYIDFGVIGVAIYALLFSQFVFWLGQKMLIAGRIGQYVAVYIGISLMFVLRGTLMSTFAFTTGAVVAIWMIPVFLTNITSKINWDFKLKILQK
jgi:hypothetical protein